MTVHYYLTSPNWLRNFPYTFILITLFVFLSYNSKPKLQIISVLCVWWLTACVIWTEPWMCRHLVRHYSGCGCEVFLDEINIWISKRGKADCPVLDHFLLLRLNTMHWVIYKWQTYLAHSSAVIGSSLCWAPSCCILAWWNEGQVNMQETERDRMWLIISSGALSLFT
jgi:hypothetical protein